MLILIMILYMIFLICLLSVGKLNIVLNIQSRMLMLIFLFVRIERLELFDEFEEWHMMQASILLFCAKSD